MKSIKNSNLLMVVGLLLQVSLGFAHPNPKAEQGSSILERIKREKNSNESYTWKPSGPTEQDIRAATKVENLASKGSLEDQLISAVKNGDLKNVETCIATGANVNAKDPFDRTVLFHAVDKGHTETVKLLIAHGAAKNEKNFTDLFVSALFKGNTEMVKALIAEDAKIDFETLEAAYMIVNRRNTELLNIIKHLKNSKIAD